jgi:hypothetical protein
VGRKSHNPTPAAPIALQYWFDGPTASCVKSDLYGMKARLLFSGGRSYANPRMRHFRREPVSVGSLFGAWPVFRGLSICVPILSMTAQKQDSAQRPLASSCTRSVQRDYSGDPGSWRHISKHSGFGRLQASVRSGTNSRRMTGLSRSYSGPQVPLEDIVSDAVSEESDV